MMSSTVSLFAPGMHLSICPKTKFIGTLDLLFTELKVEKVETVMISQELEIVYQMCQCMAIRQRMVCLMSVVRRTLNPLLNWMLRRAFQSAFQGREMLAEQDPQQMQKMLEIPQLLRRNRCSLYLPSMIDDARSLLIFRQMMQSRTSLSPFSVSRTHPKSPKLMFWCLHGNPCSSTSLRLKYSLKSSILTSLLSMINISLYFPSESFLTSFLSTFSSLNNQIFLDCNSLNKFRQIRLFDDLSSFEITNTPSGRSLYPSLTTSMNLWLYSLLMNDQLAILCSKICSTLSLIVFLERTMLVSPSKALRKKQEEDYFFILNTLSLVLVWELSSGQGYFIYLCSFWWLLLSIRSMRDKLLTAF